METKEPAILETSVLLNFISVDKLTLLASHPKYRFAITDHVRADIKDDYPEEKARLDAALSARLLEETAVESEAELALFAALTNDRRLGVGECSAIAAACVRRLPLAMDDVRATKEALKHCAHLKLLDTKGIVVDLINAQALTVGEADAFNDAWRQSYRFNLKIKTFRDLL